nr:GRF-interacting factor 1 [Aegilops tauschii subsp. strangulata]
MEYLDENKQLILAILDNQNNGKVEECAHQPPQTASLSQYRSNLMMRHGLQGDREATTMQPPPPDVAQAAGGPFSVSQPWQDDGTAAALSATKSTGLSGRDPAVSLSSGVRDGEQPGKAMIPGGSRDR